MQEFRPDRVEVEPCADGWAVSVKADHVFLNHQIVHVAHDAPPEEQRRLILEVLVAWRLDVPPDVAWQGRPDGTYLLRL